MTVVPRIVARLSLLVALVLALVVVQLFSAGPARAVPTPAYDSIPTALPPSWVSLGYQATQTAEFGDLVELGGPHRELDSVVVGLVDWACETGGGATCVTTPGATWTHPITVNVYAEGAAGLPGALLGSVTETVTIPYRPSADATNCGAGATTWFNVATGTCHNGFAFTASFDFAPLFLLVPDRVIVTVAYDTQTYGAAPLGVDGPYNSLNVALVENTAPTVGSDVDTDSMYWNTSTAAWYADAGAAGSGLLRDDDAGWAGYALALEVVTDTALSTLPDPGTGTPPTLPTLAATGGEPNPVAGVAGLLAVLVGVVLVAAASRRPGAHRA